MKIIFRWVVFCSALACTTVARADIHALLLTIADYPKPYDLPGVKYDLELGKKLARWMKVPDQQITVIQDGSLKLEGFRRTLDTFAASVKSGDDVFLYYSGHGGRQGIAAGSDNGAQCEEAFVAADLQFYLNKEFKAWLDRLSARANKVIIFADSCHSGGMASKGLTRSVQGADDRPKFLDKAAGGGAQASCEPVNLAKSIIMTRSIKSNAVYVAAAMENEVAWAPSNGSAASQAWTKCLDKQGLDADGSGGVTVEELQTCAQNYLDSRGTNQHVTAIGNTKMVLGFEKTATPAPSRPDSTAPPAATPAPTPLAPQQATSALPAMLADISNNGDPKRRVTITPIRSTATIGRDKVEFDITTSEPGFLYILFLGSDGKTIDLLFPNKLDGENAISVGTQRFPRASWQITAGGPIGIDRVVAIVSPVKRNFGQLAAGQQGPFSLLVDADSPTSGKTRNLMVEAIRPSSPDCGLRGCNQSYGVGIAEVQEIK